MANMDRKMFKVVIHASDEEALTNLLRQRSIDIGCTGGIRQHSDGSFTVQGYMPESNIETLPKAGLDIKVFKDVSSTSQKRQKEIPKGDRFVDPKKVPSGFGRKE